MKLKNCLSYVRSIIKPVSGWILVIYLVLGNYVMFEYSLNGLACNVMQCNNSL